MWFRVKLFFNPSFCAFMIHHDVLVVLCPDVVASIFCLSCLTRTYERTTELRRLCDTLRQHISNLQKHSAAQVHEGYAERWPDLFFHD